MRSSEPRECGYLVRRLATLAVERCPASLVTITDTEYRVSAFNPSTVTAWLVAQGAPPLVRTTGGDPEPSTSVAETR